MKQKIKSSYIKYGILYPGKDFKGNFPKINVPFTILADNERFIVHIDKANRIALKKWTNWSKVKPGDTITLYELAPKKKYRLEHTPKRSGHYPTHITAEKDERYDKYNSEQEEIVKTIKEEIKDLKEGYNKYKGDMTAQVIISHISKYLPTHLKIVGHDYFIHKHPTEWDAMIVKKDAKTHFNTYDPKDVKVVIETKESGFREKDIPILKSNFNKIKSKLPKIKCLLIIARCANKKHIKPFENAYIFSGYGWVVKNYLGKWKDLVEFVKKL